MHPPPPTAFAPVYVSNSQVASFPIFHYTTASFIKLKVKPRTHSFMKDSYFPITLQFAVAAELVVYRIQTVIWLKDPDFQFKIHLLEIVHLCVDFELAGFCGVWPVDSGLRMPPLEPKGPPDETRP